MGIDKITIDPDIRLIVGIKSAERIRKRILEGRIKHPKDKQKTPGKWLIGGSRHLLSGINYQIRGDKVVLGVTGPAQRYAQGLHEGLIIRPRKAKFLAIPLTPAARVMRPRDFEDTFIRNGIIFRVKDKKPEALYLLRKSVEIPAFDYLKLEDEDKKIIVSLVRDHLVRKHG